MALIANLSIVLGANTQKAERSLNRSASIVDRLQRSVKGLAAAFLSYVAVTRVLDGVGQSFERIDRLAKTANKLALPVRDVQSFALAAELAGSNFETIAKALSVLQRRASEARVGLSTAVRPLEQLNINVEKFNKLDTTQQFRVIAEAMKNVADQTDRARIANELFGRAGVELLPLLNGGAAALDSAADAIERYGAGIDDFDAKKIEEANDAWTRLEQVLNRLYDTLAIQLAPTAAAAAALFTKAAVKVADALAVVGRFLATSTGQIVAWVAATAAIATVIPLVISGISALVKAFRALIGTQVILQALRGPAGILLLGAAGVAAAGAMAWVNEEMKAFNDELAKAQANADKFADTDIVGDLMGDIDEFADKLNTTAGSIGDTFRTRAESLTESLRTPFEQFQDRLEEIRSLMFFLDPETIQRGIASAVDQYAQQLESSLPSAILANIQGAERGSQDAFAREMSKYADDNTNIQEQILAAEQDGNRVMEEIHLVLKNLPTVLTLGL